jgi:hypothetical protein
VKAEVRAFLKEWLKTEVTQGGAEEVAFPEGASIHQLHLLRRACNALTPSVCDIDQYIDSPAIQWDLQD